LMRQSDFVPHGAPEAPGEAPEPVAV
jgi:hypothetical protein